MLCIDLLAKLPKLGIWLICVRWIGIIFFFYRMSYKIFMLYDYDATIALDKIWLSYLCSRQAFLSCYLKNIKFYHNSIHALIERWRYEMYMFHLKNREMTSTVQDVTILLGFSINGRTFTFEGHVIMLYYISIHLKWHPFY